MGLRRQQLVTLLFSICVFARATPSLANEAPTAQEVMARVATNQDGAQAARARYVYVQHARVASRKGKKVMCEETTDFRVTPLPSGSHKALLHLDGRLWHKGSYMPYHDLKKEPASKDRNADDDHNTLTITDEDDMDRDLVENMRRNLTDDDSKDGFNAGLFPLSSKGQERSTFALVGRERMNGRDVFHVTFTPKDKEDFDWQGDAYIDADAYQPVLVRTRLSRNIPFLVRTMLGTSVPGLGFSATYAPQQDGVWFPTSFGTEFKINVLFFLRRHITVAVENEHFEKTHGEGRIVSGAVPVQAAKPD